jgi:hypothetical protein
MKKYINEKYTLYNIVIETGFRNDFKLEGPRVSFHENDP